MRSSLILSAAIAVLSSSLVLHSEAQQLCNGYADLCAKTYEQVAYATTHNAYAYTPAGALALNQNNDIPTQLNDGVRALMLDAYDTPSNNANDIELCHTSCNLLDAGTLSKTLGQIKTFMDANPNEVITIFWENAGNLTPAHFQTVYQAAGMSNYLYTQQESAAAWPTLATMISSGKRLVNFVDSGADASVPWLMAEYDFVFETPWQISKGAAYPCTVDRPKDQRKPMYVLNHFISGNLTVDGQQISIPQPGLASQTNGADLVSHVNDCKTTFNQMPNFLAVDFYDNGTVFQTLASVNGVQWDGKLPTQHKSGSTSGNGAASAMSGVGAVSIGMVALTTVLGFLAL
ncbi:PLC-like phosphodiesterase [Gamsiella multidivaricata]|uniref:PLC-like phosphodiesterase n=1 Tax=Gamsiella multidivaricata TaxID=101098 RepID=UPI00221F1E57|nr:PLC-like phosphodiesterase [Gamsiella multidivaricata]KAG0362000.1 hypothetical protein BGZ54_008827 [Gamsiella multidivaricata]KAI7827027.1 PLC-like phosphodiesterase [Gamsiella multidivaricata]